MKRSATRPSRQYRSRPGISLEPQRPRISRRTVVVGGDLFPGLDIAERGEADRLTVRHQVKTGVRLVRVVAQRTPPQQHGGFPLVLSPNEVVVGQPRAVQVLDFLRGQHHYGSLL